jgi:large subunit ribosomal protein L18
LAKGARYRVPYRRRREAKTNYRTRRILARSDKPRFVIRSSNKNISIQLVTSKIEGDIVHAQANSHELEDHGWLGGRKNTPAAYLLGLLIAQKALKLGIESANLDIGLARPTRGAKLFAAVKGAQDAGLEIPCDSDAFPDPHRIKGEAISNYAASIEEPYEYDRLFSGYLKRGLKPQELPDHFKIVKDGIMEDSTI